MNSEVILPSGAILRITLSPFAISKALYQACLTELKTLKVDGEADVDFNLIKDIVCAGFSSPLIDKALAECLKRCTYNGIHITDATFEPAESRQDFAPTLLEVASANILPFTKSLTPQLNRIKGLLGNSPKST